MLKNNIINVACFIFLVITTTVTGFSILPGSNTNSKPTRTATVVLNAWSIPPVNFNKQPYGGISNTWYNEHNPTARKVVYQDDQSEPYRYAVSFGDDWFSTEQQDEEYLDESDNNTNGNNNNKPRRPIRSAAMFARQCIRRITK